MGITQDQYDTLLLEVRRIAEFQREMARHLGVKIKPERIPSLWDMMTEGERKAVEEIPRKSST
jgi:hypothetical protein